MAAITLDQALRTARAFQQIGELEAAENLYRQVLAVEPGRTDLWHAVATMAQADGRPEEAVVCLLRAVEHAPDNPEYHLALGRNYRLTRRTEDAIASFRRVTALTPNAVGAHVSLGEALASLGKFDEAIQSYEQALAFEPGCAEAQRNLSNARGQRIVGFTAKSAEEV
jgi:tetratricopeptide (TPR) repeat protein